MCYKITVGYIDIPIIMIKGECEMTAKQIIEEIARKAGVSAEEVESEMKNAIRLGFRNSDKDSTASEMWKSMSSGGEEPSVEEFLLFVTKQVRQRLA